MVHLAHVAREAHGGFRLDGYRRREPQETVLYQTVAETLGPPPQDDGMPGTEADADRGAKALRPRLDRTEGSLGPIRATDETCHHAFASEDLLCQRSAGCGRQLPIGRSVVHVRPLLQLAGCLTHHTASAEYRRLLVVYCTRRVSLLSRRRHKQSMTFSPTGHRVSCAR